METDEILCMSGLYDRPKMWSAILKRFLLVLTEIKIVNIVFCYSEK